MSSASFLIPRSKLNLHPSDPIELISEELVEIPLLGWTSAGQPVEMHVEYDTVQVPANMVKKETFALRVRGSSMIDEYIHDGDIVIIERRSTAENGESVVVRINNEEVTMKKIFIGDDGVRLQPANDQMDPIYLKNEDIEVIGIVKGIIRQPK
jgi:repressor LexA